MSERMIAVCSPELHGDTLWAVPAARALAARHGCRADFWLSPRARNIVDILGAQRFVRNVIIEESWHLEGDLTQVQVVDGVEIRESRGVSHVIKAAFNPVHGYEIVYQLGFSSTLELHGTLLDYFCTLAGVGRQGHHFDIPDGCPKEPIPEGPFVAMINRHESESKRTGWYWVLRDFVRHCPIPVVSAGLPGTALANDLGAIDRTRDGFLEMAGIISKCKYYVGNMSAPLVLADSFPEVIRICLTEGPENLGACTRSPKNFYPRASHYLELLQYIEEAR